MRTLLATTVAALALTACSTKTLVNVNLDAEGLLPPNTRANTITVTAGMSTLVYGLTIASCALVNSWVKHWPIGDWAPGQIAKTFWLDNVSWQIFAVWWACLFAVCGLWPFHRIAAPLVRGIVVTLVSWGLGWLTAKGIFTLGLGVDWIFPIVGTAWFFLAFFCFNGESWLVRGFSNGRQFWLLLILIVACTYLVTHSSIRWIPAWWFPFNLIGAATGTLAYLTRGMTQPAKAVTQMALLFACAA